jgi:hypothetical protein
VNLNQPILDKGNNSDQGLLGVAVMGLYINKFMAFALMAVSAACASTDEVALKAPGAVPTKAAVMLVTPSVSQVKPVLKVQSAVVTTQANAMDTEVMEADTEVVSTAPSAAVDDAHSCSSFCGLPSKYRAK